MDVISHLEQRVDEAKRDLQDAHDKVQEWMLKKEMLGAELQGYERALAAEKRRQGRVDVADAPRAVSISLSDSIAVADSATVEIQNKAEFARKFIRGRGDVGATPNDIMKGFQDAGIPIKKPYIYALVQRLQKQEVIKPGSRLRDRGKWFPTSVEQPESSNRQAT